MSSTARGGDARCVDAVAEAIWQAAFPSGVPDNYDWAYGPEDGQWGRETFRRMAKAAVAALTQGQS